VPPTRAAMTTPPRSKRFISTTQQHTQCRSGARTTKDQCRRLQSFVRPEISTDRPDRPAG
jgi:hypothetical protein